MESPTRRGFLKAGTAALIAASAAPSPTFAETQTAPGHSERLPRIRVHQDGHLLQTEDGKPFFWLGDTAWQLIASTTREECSHYLQTRSRQGYSIFQTVVLAEMDGIHNQTPLGLLPFENDDPRKPVDAYFDRVVEVVREAESRGLYVALVPVWGDKLTAPWGAGPRIFRNDNLADAEGYARYLANRMRGEPNVVWILGGDRPPQLKGIEDKGMLERAAKQGWPADTDWKPIWRALAKGLRDGSDGEPLVLYHPSGGAESSSVFLHNEPWLSVNGIQSGHSAHDADIWNQIARDYALSPAKPTLDLEPNYEDHPFSPWPNWDPATGYFRDHDVRKQVYRSVFAGGCGVTYGHHAIWQFADARNGIINHADMDWVTALERPGGRQMVFLRQLIESRPYFARIPDPSLLVDDGGQGILHMQATRDREGSYAMVYVPMHDQEVRLNLAKLRTRHLRTWWYDTRTGFTKPIGIETYPEQATFKTPPYGPDWVLVLDDANAGYGVPGIR